MLNDEIKRNVGHFNQSISRIYMQVYAHFLLTTATAAVAQWARAFACQAEGWVFESQPRQTHVVKTSSDIPMAKRSA